MDTKKIVIGLVAAVGAFLLIKKVGATPVSAEETGLIVTATFTEV
jgi:hypothetical protein